MKCVISDPQGAQECPKYLNPQTNVLVLGVPHLGCVTSDPKVAQECSKYLNPQSERSRTRCVCWFSHLGHVTIFQLTKWNHQVILSFWKYCNMTEVSIHSSFEQNICLWSFLLQNSKKCFNCCFRLRLLAFFSDYCSLPLANVRWYWCSPSIFD